MVLLGETKKDAGRDHKEYEEVLVREYLKSKNQTKGKAGADRLAKSEYNKGLYAAVECNCLPGRSGDDTE